LKKVAWIWSHHLHLLWKFKLSAGKFPWGVKVKHCWAFSTNFLIQKVISQQCFVLFPQVNIPANNLNFDWSWGWLDLIQAIFLYLFYFTKSLQSFFFSFFPTILRTNFLMRRFFSPKLLDVVFIIEKGLVQKNSLAEFKMFKKAVVYYFWVFKWNYYTFLFTYAYSKEMNFLLKKTYQSILIFLHQSFQVPSSLKVSKSFHKIA